jgi:flagellin
MASVLNTNMASISAQRYLNVAQNRLASSYEKLSSGSRINRAQDDSAGLGISQNLTASLGGTTFAIRNANDAIGTLQTAEGALAEISAMLQRFKELATQGNNEALSDTQRGYLANEMKELGEEIEAIAKRTTFNENPLLGTAADTLKFQTGVSETDVQEVDFVDILTDTDYTQIQSLLPDALTPPEAAADFASLTEAIEAAINEIAGLRAEFGSKVNRITSNLNNLDALGENLSAARSRVLDTDYAAETAMLTRTQILQQAATAMLSQANAQPNVILALLK